MKRGLIIFAREPLPGRVKSRLAVSIGDHAAAEWYEFMLQEVLETSRQLDGIETVIFWDCEEHSLRLLAERYGCRSRRQGSGDLGQRMLAAFSEMFEGGCETCCIIGSDSPDLPPAYVRDAFAQLATEQVDITLGPATDGGYYLLGMRQPWAQLFDAIDWSTSSVHDQSLAAARNSGLNVALLPIWYDIDTVEDLQAFQERKNMTLTTNPAVAV